MRSFGRAPPELAPLPRGATVEFWAENWDLARPPPGIEDGESRVEPTAMKRSNGLNRKEKCLFLACLLACCLLLACLLARFKGRGGSKPSTHYYVWDGKRLLLLTW